MAIVTDMDHERLVRKIAETKTIINQAMFDLAELYIAVEPHIDRDQKGQTVWWFIGKIQKLDLDHHQKTAVIAAHLGAIGIDEPPPEIAEVLYEHLTSLPGGNPDGTGPAG